VAMATQGNNFLSFYLNGEKVVVPGKKVQPDMPLSEYLRANQITSVKNSCSEGGCGSCTVMLSRFDEESKKVVVMPIQSCLTPLAMVDHCSIWTVEGISKGKKKLEELEPFQESLAKNHGTQCGYCSPGMVMSVHTQLEQNPTSSIADIEQCLEGNMCRCTGYRAVLDSLKIAHNADQQQHNAPGQLGSLCPCTKASGMMQRMPFPEELQKNPPPMLRLAGADDHVWYRPTTLQQLLALLPLSADSKLVSGFTHILYKGKYYPHRAHYRTYIATNMIPEMKILLAEQMSMTLGANTSMEDWKTVCQQIIEKNVGGVAGNKLSTVHAILRLLKLVGNKQVRSTATIGGSLCGDTLSDIYPILMAAGATCNIIDSHNNTRTIPLSQLKTDGYTLSLRTDELLLSVQIPYHANADKRLSTQTCIVCEKISKRRIDDRPLVNVAFRFALDKVNNDVVVKDCAAYAVGLCKKYAAVPLVNTQKALIGQVFNMNTIYKAVAAMADESFEPVKTPELLKFQITILRSMLYKAYLYVCDAIGIPLAPELKSAIAHYEHVIHTATHDFADVKDTAMGKPIQREEALAQVTGKARFIADEPLPPNTLYGALIISTRAHANILNVDTTEAMKIKGVHHIYTAKDVPGRNWIGSVDETEESREEFFASKTVNTYAQVIGIVLGETQQIATAGAAAVKITYEDLPTLFEIEDAIKANSYLGHKHVPEKGDTDAVIGKAKQEQEEYERELSSLKQSSSSTSTAAEEKTLEKQIKLVEGKNNGIVIEEKIFIDGQYHFYWETQSCYALPREGGLYVGSSTQMVAGVQHAICTILGLPRNKVQVGVLRIGGGFGGKQERPKFLGGIVGLAAHLSQRPVKLTLDRQTDIQVTGKRHPFLFDYKVAANRSDGKIRALQCKMYANGGHSKDLSLIVAEVALFTIDSGYYLPTSRLQSWGCKTNLPSNTAYRGFGKPQATWAIEVILDHLCRSLHLDPMQIRENNLYHKGDLDSVKLPVDDDHIRRLWKELKDRCKYDELKKSVDEFNKANKWVKRGLAIIPCKNNTGFEKDFLNVTGALVQIYTDGSVFVSHGGIDMGQGLHTKCRQVAADVLGIPIEYVTVGDTDTHLVPNTVSTAATIGSDTSGWATHNACKQLAERLAPLRKEFPDKSWPEICNLAWLRMISLSAAGYHAHEPYAFNFDTKVGATSYYHIWSTACCVVELHVLTGQWRILRLDCMSDMGKCVNPAIDITQLEGGFIQGLGLYTMEELIYAKDGHIRTRNVSTLKLPTVDDVPLEWNVGLLQPYVENRRGIGGGKPVGEQGLQMATVAWLAIKHAIYAAREDQGLDGYFYLQSPATVDRIRMALPTPFNVTDEPKPSSSSSSTH